MSEDLLDGLEQQSYVCPKCLQVFLTSEIVVTEKYVGYQTPVHACGPGYMKAVLMPVDKETRELFEKALETVK